MKIIFIFVIFIFYSFTSIEKYESNLFYKSNIKIKNPVKEKIVRASWYGPGFHGKKTANGEYYDMNRLTAAHKTLCFGTRVKIINIENGKSIIVKINDRGPYIAGRDFDLSKAAFAKVASIKTGVIRIKYEILK